MDIKYHFLKAFHRNSFPSYIVLSIRAISLYLVSLVVSPVVSSLAFAPASYLVLGALSCLLNLMGITHYWHKYMLTTPYNTIIVQWMDIPFHPCFILLAIMLWMPGQLILKAGYAIGGIAAIFLLSLAYLLCSVFELGPNTLSLIKLSTIGIQYLLVFVAARLYIAKHLTAHTTQARS